MLKELKKKLYTNQNIQLLKPATYIQDKLLKSWIIQIIFIIVAIIFGISFFFNKGLFQSDDLFHMLRLKEIGLSLSHGQWSQFNIYTGNPVGVAINTFYPYVLLIPLALISMCVSLPQLSGITEFILSLIGLETCYYCFYKIGKNSKLASFLISICYWFSTTMFIATVTKAFDVGAMVAYIFVPVVFIGWLKWIQDNHWKMLTIGLLGMLLSNLPACLIMIITIIILTVLQIKHTNISMIKALFKAVISFFLCGAFFLVPSIILHCTNKIYYPNLINIKQHINTPIIPTSLIKCCVPFSYGIWDIIGAIAILMMLIYWKHLPNFIKQIGVLAIAYIIINIKIINEFLIECTPLHVLQSLGRVACIENFLLCIVLTYTLNYIFKKSTKQDLWQGIIYFVLLIHGFWLIFMPIKMNMTNYSRPNIPKSMYNTTIKNSYQSTQFTRQRKHQIFKVFNNNTNHTSITPLFYPDYSPLQTLRIKNNGKLKGTTKMYYKNGFRFKHIKHVQEKRIPLVLYHQQKYQVSNNNKLVHIKYNQHFTVIKLHKGTNNIKIKTPMMWYRYIGLIGSLIGISLLCTPVRKKKFNDK